MKGAGNAARAVILLCKLLARLLARLPGGHGKDPADQGWRSLRDSPETLPCVVGSYPRPLGSGRNVAGQPVIPKDRRSICRSVDWGRLQFPEK